MQIVFQAMTGGSVTNMRYEADGYVLQPGEHVYPGEVTPILNPCSIYDGTTIQVQAGKWAALTALVATDAEMSRATEDIIDLLATKGLVALTDLPQATQGHYNAKKAARVAYLAK